MCCIGHCAWMRAGGFSHVCRDEWAGATACNKSTPGGMRCTRFTSSKLWVDVFGARGKRRSCTHCRHPGRAHTRWGPLQCNRHVESPNRSIRKRELAKRYLCGFGIGKGHLPVMFAMLANDMHLRVGMEDNVVYGRDKDGKKILATNLMLVERAARAVEAYGNEVATSAEAREMLGLAPLDHAAVCEALDKITVEQLEAAKVEAGEKYGTTYFAAKSMG